MSEKQPVRITAVPAEAKAITAEQPRLNRAARRRLARQLKRKVKNSG